MTDEELAEIEKACAEATPGPWRFDGVHTAVFLKSPAGFVLCLEAGMSSLVADERFIAGARQWVPDLLAEVRRLRAKEGRLNEECGTYLDRLQRAHEEEREACAKLCEDTGLEYRKHIGERGMTALANNLAAAIRARGNSDT